MTTPGPTASSSFPLMTTAYRSPSAIPLFSRAARASASPATAAGPSWSGDPHAQQQQQRTRWAVLGRRGRGWGKVDLVAGQGQGKTATADSSDGEEDDDFEDVGLVALERTLHAQILSIVSALGLVVLPNLGIDLVLDGPASQFQGRNKGSAGKAVRARITSDEMWSTIFHPFLQPTGNGPASLVVSAFAPLPIAAVLELRVLPEPVPRKQPIFERSQEEQENNQRQQMQLQLQHQDASATGNLPRGVRELSLVPAREDDSLKSVVNRWKSLAGPSVETTPPRKTAISPITTSFATRELAVPSSSPSSPPYNPDSFSYSPSSFGPPSPLATPPGGWPSPNYWRAPSLDLGHRARTSVAVTPTSNTSWGSASPVTRDWEARGTPSQRSVIATPDIAQYAEHSVAMTAGLEAPLASTSYSQQISQDVVVPCVTDESRPLGTPSMSASTSMAWPPSSSGKGSEYNIDSEDLSPVVLQERGLISPALQLTPVVDSHHCAQISNLGGAAPGSMSSLSYSKEVDIAPEVNFQAIQQQQGSSIVSEQLLSPSLSPFVMYSTSSTKSPIMPLSTPPESPPRPHEEYNASSTATLAASTAAGAAAVAGAVAVASRSPAEPPSVPHSPPLPLSPPEANDHGHIPDHGSPPQSASSSSFSTRPFSARRRAPPPPLTVSETKPLPGVVVEKCKILGPPPSPAPPPAIARRRESTEVTPSNSPMVERSGPHTPFPPPAAEMTGRGMRKRAGTMVAPPPLPVLHNSRARPATMAMVVVSSSAAVGAGADAVSRDMDDTVKDNEAEKAASEMAVPAPSPIASAPPHPMEISGTLSPPAESDTELDLSQVTIQRKTQNDDYAQREVVSEFHYYSKQQQLLKPRDVEVLLHPAHGWPFDLGLYPPAPQDAATHSTVAANVLAAENSFSLSSNSNTTPIPRSAEPIALTQEASSSTVAVANPAHFRELSPVAAVTITEVAAITAVAQEVTFASAGVESSDNKESPYGEELNGPSSIVSEQAPEEEDDDDNDDDDAAQYAQYAQFVKLGAEEDSSDYGFDDSSQYNDQLSAERDEDDDSQDTRLRVETGDNDEQRRLSVGGEDHNDDDDEGASQYALIYSPELGLTPVEWAQEEPDWLRQPSPTYLTDETRPGMSPAFVADGKDEADDNSEYDEEEYFRAEVLSVHAAEVVKETSVELLTFARRMSSPQPALAALEVLLPGTKDYPFTSGSLYPRAASAFQEMTSPEVPAGQKPQLVSDVEFDNSGLHILALSRDVDSTPNEEEQQQRPEQVTESTPFPLSSRTASVAIASQVVPVSKPEDIEVLLHPNHGWPFEDGLYPSFASVPAAIVVPRALTNIDVVPSPPVAILAAAGSTAETDAFFADSVVSNSATLSAALAVAPALVVAPALPLAVSSIAAETPSSRLATAQPSVLGSPLLDAITPLSDMTHSSSPAPISEVTLTQAKSRAEPVKMLALQPLLHPSTGWPFEIGLYPSMAVPTPVAVSFSPEIATARSFSVQNDSAPKLEPTAAADSPSAAPNPLRELETLLPGCAGYPFTHGIYPSTIAAANTSSHPIVASTSATAAFETTTHHLYKKTHKTHLSLHLEVVRSLLLSPVPTTTPVPRAIPPRVDEDEEHIELPSVGNISGRPGHPRNRSSSRASIGNIPTTSGSARFPSASPESVEASFSPPVEQKDFAMICDSGNSSKSVISPFQNFGFDENDDPTGAAPAGQKTTTRRQDLRVSTTSTEAEWPPVALASTTESGGNRPPPPLPSTSIARSGIYSPLSAVSSSSLSSSSSSSQQHRQQQPASRPVSIASDISSINRRSSSGGSSVREAARRMEALASSPSSPALPLRRPLSLAGRLRSPPVSSNGDSAPSMIVRRASSFGQSIAPKAKN